MKDNFTIANGFLFRNEQKVYANDNDANGTPVFTVLPCKCWKGGKNADH